MHYAATALENRSARPSQYVPAKPAASRLMLVEPGTLLYNDAFDLSSAQYHQHFNCELREAYPAYLCLLRRDQVVATCGVRSAVTTLFLQQYLDTEVTQMLSDRLGQTILPGHLVELGAFSVRKRSLALPFMATLVPALTDLGFTHAVATATLPVRRCLRNLGIPTVTLGAASKEALSRPTSEWGSYYQMRPAVIAGAIEDASLVVSGGIRQ